MYHTRLLFSFSIILLIAAGCADLGSYTRMTDQARLSISQGRFEDALTVFPEKSARGRNEVLVRLERALLLQNMGRYDESAREFELAVARIRGYEGKAVVSATRTASQIGSLILNEKVRPYEGEDFEKILIHAFDAVNYLMKGDLEGARVEIRNAYQRQNELYARHEKELEKAAKESRGASWEQSFQKADRSRYEELRQKSDNVLSVYQNAFAYYISSLVYELGGEKDEAYIDLKKAILAAPWSKSIQKDLIRLSRDLGYPDDEKKWQADYGNLGSGYGRGVDVFVIFQHGAAPVKEALQVPIPLSEGGFVFTSLPVYRFIPSGIRSCTVTYNGQELETSPVSDIEAIASRNLLDRYPILFAKQVARSYLKARMTNKLSKDYGAIGAVTGTLASAVTEQADLRTWAVLPKEIQVARIFIPKETRAITVRSIPTNHEHLVDVNEGARHLIVLCRDTDAGLSLQTKAY
ncbi:MAG TPA: hypothetical protein PLF54_08385 [Deltaproteobacteria bacterium]|jgi:hypothetical protein|nr:hypothetical protein [Deltaproteobacteria bacterium]HQJ09005.1 hypothetical protein [Deltaproteobacteria bacterium]